MKKELFLLIVLCLITFLVSNEDVKSQVVYPTPTPGETYTGTTLTPYTTPTPITIDPSIYAAGIPGHCAERTAVQCTTKKGVCGCNKGRCQLTDCVLDGGECKCPDPPGP